MPRALQLYVSIYDHFLGATVRRGGERGVPLWLYHSINKGRTHSRGAHSSSSQQPALWKRQYTLLWAHISLWCRRCVCVCVADGVRSLCSWGKWWRHPTDPLQTAGKTLMSLWTCWEVCVHICVCVVVYLPGCVYAVLCFQICNFYPRTQ